MAEPTPERTPQDDTTERLRERLIQVVFDAGREVDVNAVRAIAADIAPELERLQQRLAALQDREERELDPLRRRVAELQAEVTRLTNELGQYRLDEQYEAMATAGAFDEEDPY